MSEIQSLNIDGRVYRLVVMPPWQGAGFAAEVASLMAGALAGEAAEAGAMADMRGDLESGGVSEDTLRRITSMILRILPHFRPSEFTRLARQAFQASELSIGEERLSDEGLFDQHFSRHRGDYFPVAIWAIKENCSGFFTGGGPAWSALAGQFLPSGSPTDGQEIGSSGGS